MEPNELVLFTIFDHPLDYPRSFVVRCFHPGPNGTVVPDPRPYALATSLAAARHVIPEGLVNLGREVGDDPMIVETWI